MSTRTDAEEIAHSLGWLESHEGGADPNPAKRLAKLLAALIRRAYTWEDCCICGGSIHERIVSGPHHNGGYKQRPEVLHSIDCALITLAKELNSQVVDLGEEP